MQKQVFKFQPRYFILTVILFLIEVLIALYMHDEFIRPTLGDLLVVILLYCLLRSVVVLPVLTASIFVLLFAYTVEFLQYLNIVEKLGLQHSETARTIIGTSFSCTDIAAYSLGIIFVIIIERITAKKSHN